MVREIKKSPCRDFDYGEEWYRAKRDWSLACLIKEKIDEQGRDAVACELEVIAQSVREKGIPKYDLPF